MKNKLPPTADFSATLYLAMMAPRLIELKQVLKVTGSIYLHRDPTASHYLKMLMDAIFSPQNFRNEIIWKRTSAHSSAKRYGPVHDVILFYGASDGMKWVGLNQSYSPDYIDHRFRTEEDGPGRTPEEVRLMKCLVRDSITHIGQSSPVGTTDVSTRAPSVLDAEITSRGSGGSAVSPGRKPGCDRFKITEPLSGGSAE